MIRLKKGPEPTVLRRNGDRWAREYNDGLARGLTRKDLPSRYRHAEVKAAVIAETHDKCLFCESKISHSHFGDIEHIQPVAVFPDKICAWDNLSFVCARCNNNKLDYWDPVAAIVNPYSEDPDDHIEVIGPYLLHVANDVRGQISITTLDLNRIDLVERRMERIERLAPLRDQYLRMPEGAARDAVGRQILREAEPAREYAAAVRAFIELHLPRLIGAPTVNKANPG